MYQYVIFVLVKIYIVYIYIYISKSQSNQEETFQQSSFAPCRRTETKQPRAGMDAAVISCDFDCETR